MRLPRRYDDTLMQPPETGGAVDTALLATLRAWCETGAFPLPAEPLRVARIAPHAGLDAVASVLDGSAELASLGRWRGLAWRVQILWHERVVQRPANPGDPWDCGWWREDSLGAAQAFQPRRATLLMLRDPVPAAAASLLATLRERSPGYVRPLRVLWVSDLPMTDVASL